MIDTAMKLHSVKKILLIQSLEKNDPEGTVLSHAARIAATAEVRMPEDALQGKAFNEGKERFLTERANLLIAQLKASQTASALLSLLNPVQTGYLAAMAVLLVAFTLGFLSNYISSEKSIDIIAFPMLGLIIWNVLIYFCILLGWLWQAYWPKKGVLPGYSILEYLVPKIRQHIEAKALRHVPVHAHEDEATRVVFKSQRSFAREWLRLTAPLHVYTLRLVLHLAAAITVVGMVLGMYVRGLHVEYKAVWEATFVSVALLQQYLEIVLGPASFVTGIGIPPGKPLAELTSPLGENAAAWIHLYAVTAALYILVPRTMLALLTFLQRRRLRDNLPVEDVFLLYYQALVRSVMDDGTNYLVAVIPYDYRLGTKGREAIRGLLPRLWHRPLHIDFWDNIPYEEEEQLLARLETLPAYVVLVMDFNATPEHEAHGCIVRALQQWIAACPDTRHLLMLLDDGHFRKHADQPGFARRLHERQRAWQSIITGDPGIQLAHFDSTSADSLSETVPQANEALRPTKDFSL